MADMTNLEKLALAEAIMKALKPLTDRRGGKGGADNLRTMADDELLEMYAQSGADRKQITIGDVKVGTLSISFTKPEHKLEIDVQDTQKLVEWLRTTDEGKDTLEKMLVNLTIIKAVAEAAKSYGFLPDGCAMVEVDSPSRIKGTTLRVDTQKVAEALGNRLSGAVAGLIEGGAE